MSAERSGMRAGQSLRRNRLAKKGRVLVAIRSLDGDAGGVVPKWRIGIADVSKGELNFTSTIGGILFLKRSPVTVNVTALDTGAARPTTAKEAVRLTSMSTVLPATTPYGQIELALEPQSVDWFTAHVNGESPDM